MNSNHFTVEKLHEGIYAAIAKEGGGAVANAGFIDLGGKLLIFDTFNTQQAAADLRRIAEEITNLSVIWVINSHWHGDHIRGNQIFKDCTIISSQLTYEKMKETHPSRIQEQKDDLQGLQSYIQSLQEQQDESLLSQIHFLMEIERSLPTLELVLPNQTFQQELTFHGTKRKAMLFALGNGHSCCDSILYLPAEKIAFMSDLLFINCEPILFDESNAEEWMQRLNQIATMDIHIAVPGHGPIGTKNNFSATINYLKEFNLYDKLNLI
ncbi:MAG: MBL fold metallo-hydrolase [Bacillaceae bacterium]